MSLMKDKGIVCEEYEGVGTVSYVAIDGKFVGVFKIADKVKEESSRCITKLKEKGVKKIVMLTGDNDFIAKDVGRKVGIADEDVYSMLLPHQKVAKLGELLKEKERDDTNTWVDDLVFVGDGINDAPVLIHSDIGIAMGGIGSDAAIEASDIVLMEDNPEKIVVGMNIAEETMSIVRSNIKMIIGVKILFLLLSTVGVMTMSFAVFADVGIMLIAVLRSIKGLKKGILK
jgi:Cd2+/Zn2+-exporting ATPase